MKPRVYLETSLISYLVARPSRDIVVAAHVKHGLARTMVKRGAVPAAAIADALHVAIAATNGLTHLLTWNLKHIANADSRGRLEAVCRDEGIEPPLIATPEELLEDANDVP